MTQQKQENAAGDAAARVRELRESLRNLGLAGFIVPKSDEFQNEYVPPHSDRLPWITGFTGSAGIALILQDKAALIVDSRYTLQAKAQADATLFSIEQAPKVTTASYLTQHTAKGDVIGYDPRLHTLAGFKPLREEAEKRGFILKACDPNPIDAIWRDRPAAFYAPIADIVKLLQAKVRLRNWSACRKPSMKRKPLVFSLVIPSWWRGCSISGAATWSIHR